MPSPLLRQAMLKAPAMILVVKGVSNQHCIAGGGGDVHNINLRCFCKSVLRLLARIVSWFPSFSLSFIPYWKPSSTFFSCLLPVFLRSICSLFLPSSFPIRRACLQVILPLLPFHSHFNRMFLPGAQRQLSCLFLL